jgi:PleD family two-component response regulator
MKFALVIDDTRQTADALVRVLKALNIPARAAYGPQPAMAILNVEVPDAIFLDINMPGVSGFEILGYLRREPRFSKTPVFVCTSDDQKQTKDNALKGGAKAVLIKPVTVDVLEAALKKEKLIK